MSEEKIEESLETFLKLDKKANKTPEAKRIAVRFNETLKKHVTSEIKEGNDPAYFTQKKMNYEGNYLSMECILGAEGITGNPSEICRCAINANMTAREMANLSENGTAYAPATEPLVFGFILGNWYDISRMSQAMEFCATSRNENVVKDVFDLKAEIRFKYDGNEPPSSHLIMTVYNAAFPQKFSFFDALDLAYSNQQKQDNPQCKESSQNSLNRA